MTIKRMDHVSIIVDDLPAAIAFFTTLGMSLVGEQAVEGPWVDRLNGLEDVQVDIAMMRTPDGHGQVELTTFRNPGLVDIEPAIAPPNALGLRQIMFAADDLDDTVARLRAHGAGLVGEVVQYEDMYRLCYLRGPAGIIVALAEELLRGRGVSVETVHSLLVQGVSSREVPGDDPDLEPEGLEAASDAQSSRRQPDRVSSSRRNTHRAGRPDRDDHSATRPGARRPYRRVDAGGRRVHETGSRPEVKERTRRRSTCAAGAWVRTRNRRPLRGRRGGSRRR